MENPVNPQPHPAWLHAGTAAAGQLPDPQRLASLAAFLAESASLAPLLMLHGLMRLSFCQDDQWQIAARRQQLRIAPCFEGLLERWHQHLLAEGLLENIDDRWTLAQCAPGEQQLEQRIDDARHRLRQLMSWLDDAAPLADALFSPPRQIDDWLCAPALAEDATPAASLHQLLHLPGIISDYFSGIANGVLPLLLGQPPRLLALGPTPLPLADCLSRIRAEVVQVAPGRTLASQLPGDDLHSAVAIGDLLNQPHPHHLLAELGPWLIPGAALLLTQNVEERPLHWVTPAAVRASVGGERGEPHCEVRCQQILSRAGFELLQTWPQSGTPMAFSGQRLFVARYAPAAAGKP